MKPGKTVQRSSKSALITEGLISSRVDKSRLSLLMFFLAQGTLTNHWPPSNPLWKEVRITARWFKGIVSSIAPRLLNFIEKPNTSSHCQICLAEIYMSRSWVWLRVKGNSKSVSTKTVKYQELAGSGVRSILPLLCTHTKNKALPFGVSLCGKHDAYAKKVVLLKRSHTDQFSSKTWAGHGCDLRKHFLCSSRSTHRGWAPAGCPGHGEGGCCGGGFLSTALLTWCCRAPRLFKFSSAGLSWHRETTLWIHIIPKSPLLLFTSVLLCVMCQPGISKKWPTRSPSSLLMKSGISFL